MILRLKIRRQYTILNSMKEREGTIKKKMDDKLHEHQRHKHRRPKTQAKFEENRERKKKKQRTRSRLVRVKQIAL